jgi:hypothetical protein
MFAFSSLARRLALLSGLGIMALTTAAVPAYASTSARPSVPWSENYFDFGNGPSTHTFTYQNLGHHDWIDLPVGPDYNTFSILSDTCQSPVPPGGSCSVSVSYLPNGAPATGQFQLQFTDTVTGASHLSPPVQLFGNGAEYIATNHRNGLYSFPTVTLPGASQTRKTAALASAQNPITLWLQIHGGDPVYFNSLLLGTPFQVVSNGCQRVVQQQTQCPVTVQFAPTSPGHYQATLQPSAVNPASGAGVPAQTLTLVGTAAR